MDALAYIRVSKVGGREGDSFISPGEQRKAIDAVAKREGLDIIDYYEELDASGGDNTRPLWNKALDRIEAGQAKALIVWRLDRLARSVIDGATAIKRIEDAGGKFYSAAGDSGDSSPAGQFQRNVFLAVAQMERERARDGFATAQANAVARGIHTASRIPTGYSRNTETRRLEPNGQARLIKGLFEKRSKGAALGELVLWFVENGGSPLTNRATISAMLRNPTYTGMARRGDAVNPKAHTPIVSQRLFDQVQRKEVPRKHTGEAAAASMLGGIIVCDGCGRRMGTTKNGRGSFVYRCNYQVCSSRATCMVHELDPEVIDRLFGFMNRGGTPITKRRGNEAEIAADLNEARETLADAEYLLTKFEEGKREYLKAMTPTEFATELVGLKADVEEARMALELVQVEPTPTIDVNFNDVWADEWTHESRKEFLSSAIATVIVKKSGQGRGKPIPVSERIAVKFNGRGPSGEVWLLAGGRSASEPFGQ